MCDCKGLSKIILVIVNFVFLLAGGLMLAFGIIAKVKPDLIFTLFKTIPGIDKVPQAFDLGGIVNGSAVFMIILGVAVFLVGFLGFFGACCEIQCLLLLYIVIVLVVFCGEVALIIFAAVSPDKLKDLIQKAMQKSIEKVNQDINFNGNLTLPTDEVSLGWAVLQIEAKCCGANNYTDYTRYHIVTINGNDINTTVPLSCCTTTGDIDVSKPTSPAIFTDYTKCLQSNPEFINQQNCYDAIYQLIKKSLTIAIGIAAGIAGAQLILIIAAICLCQKRSKDG